MSSSDNVIATIKLAQLYLYQVGSIILLFIGTLSSILSMAVFSQKNLRKNPCSIYLIAYNFSNLVYIYATVLPLTLSEGFNIDYTIYHLGLCHLHFYAAILFNCLSPFYLILASIDRILITSRNVHTRQRSTRRLAYLCLIIGTLFWAVFHCHALIFTEIIEESPTDFLCYYQPGAYLAFFSYYSIIKEITALSLLTIFGLWSIRNVRNAHRARVVVDESVNGTTVGGASRSTSSKDRQLALMLLLDATIYALFSFVYAGFLMYQQITQDVVKSSERTTIENFLSVLCLFMISIPFCVSLYTNLIVSKTFRSEVKKVLSCRRFFLMR
jgi:hypothetical protein